MLDQLDFVAFRRIDKSNDTSAVGLGGSIGKWITFRGGMFGECFEILNLKGEVRDIETHIYGTALVELANLNLFFAARSLEEDEF